MESTALPSTKTPVTVFSGFLGSGKTTIILNLIEQLQHREKLIYIKNEIGEENIDGAVLKGRHIQTRELLNGCICCTLVGPFVSAINEVIDSFHPDRILIEASGAADPSAIALMIDGHPRLIRDGIISIIDVVNFEGYKDISLTARNQTTFTDLILFNKVELVNLDQKRRVVEYVRELNTIAPILEAPQGIVPTAVVFGVARPEVMADLYKETRDNHGELTDHHHHLEIDGLETISFEVAKPVDIIAVKQFFGPSSLLPPAVFRVKAILKSTEGQSMLLNRVGKRTTVEILEQPTAETKLVLIGFHLEEQREHIKKILKPIIG